MSHFRFHFLNHNLIQSQYSSLTTLTVSANSLLRNNQSTQNNMRLKPHALILLSMMTVLSLSACSTVAVDKQSIAKTLVTQRGNIITDNKLSTTTSSALLSAGLNEEACMQHFDLCLDQLSDSLFNEDYRPALAVYSELYYTKALQLSSSEDCKRILDRPPIDPYYANAPLPPEEESRQQQATQQCLSEYHARVLEAIKHSYAYLFFDDLTHDIDQDNNSPKKMSRRLPTELDIQTQDIYNAASNDIITQLYKSNNNAQKLLGDAKVEYFSNRSKDTTSPDDDPTNINQIKVMSVGLKGNAPKNSVNPDYHLNIYLPDEDNYLVNASKQTNALSDLVSTYQLKLTGLNTVSKREGFGISFVATLDDRYTTSIRQLLSDQLSTLTPHSSTVTKEDSNPNSRIYPTGHLLLTALVEPSGQSVLEVIGSNDFDIHMYNPYRTDKVTLLGEDYPLAANFSASYGLWLAENQLNSVGYLNLLTRKNDASLPKLFMLQPYDPNKRVIIMLHGLASSPATWVNLTNDIFNDEALRDNYQVWQIFYPTNLPILENRYQIQKLIEAAYQQTDPEGQHPASQNSVIISHSMGAVIARMLVSDDDLSTRLDSLNDSHDKVIATTDDTPPIPVDRALSAMLKKTYEKEALSDRFDLNPLKQVDTVVFLSAPFRGTDYADRWFTRAVRRIIHLPLGLVQTVTDNLATIATQGDLTQNPLGALYLQNGASQLSDKSSFVQLTKDISIVPNVTYHSIIANADTDIAEGLAELRASMVKQDLSVADSEDTDSEALTPANADLAAADSANTINSPAAGMIKAKTRSENDSETASLDSSSRQTNPPDLLHSNQQMERSTDSVVSDSSRESKPYIAAIRVEEELGEALTDKLSDGIVPYKSSHLEGAASETIIRGGHSIQENPQTILTLRKILHQQLENDSQD